MWLCARVLEGRASVSAAFLSFFSVYFPKNLLFLLEVAVLVELDGELTVCL